MPRYAAMAPGSDMYRTNTSGHGCAGTYTEPLQLLPLTELMYITNINNSAVYHHMHNIVADVPTIDALRATPPASNRFAHFNTIVNVDTVSTNTYLMLLTGLSRFSEHTQTIC
jgi:hypothetical protein